MHIEKWIIAHFSPTGGTKKVAQAIGGGFGVPTALWDLTLPGEAPSLGEQDGLMAVLPVFAGRVPRIALERLSCLKGNAQKALAVVVYGNREFDDALLETGDALEAMGFRVVAGAAFIAEHSMARSIAANRPDEQDHALMRRFAAQVMAKEEDAPVVTFPGNRPYKELKPSAFHPEAGENCVKCGLCARLCPAGAIPPDDPSQTKNDACINCMRCVAMCPESCRALPDAFLGMITAMLNKTAGEYKTPSVFL